ncbi:hypothetical protein [Agrobacterium tumefaciens]|uniref:hypothetical protein n=1 Tax=Agrobacterium tumefaciens TaxID=358 RepID=UPI001574CB78|nr:hypothetical protein [Agrobacterium tumefaciens]NTC82136.1 hypothetical protein [Agrobacterium tumefaciens]NTD12091.1 hypothetical protein [Agrobacterium tumefaciens]NTD88380.1 hypothetical protein [Agrobacterium tumefaciens]NTD91109.1 hypothetical protein [Agrobacterium tumefaciens]NTD98555.1 hypothetical protein [Agrobacterium tumefaciens]
MDLQAELDRLREHAATLGDTIQDMDYQIERAMRAVAAGTYDVGHAMTVLTERHSAQLGLMFDLGKVTAQIEDLEQRIREQGERSHEQQLAEKWEDRAPDEDYLDWLRPVLGGRAAEPVHNEHMPEDRQHEPEDYLDYRNER